MKAKIKVAVGVLAILAAVYWAVTSVIPINYTGSNIMFPIGGGHVVVRHSGSEAIPIEIRSGERAATFRVESPAIGLAQSATRQGSGRNAFYSVHFDLPPGETRIDVTRGSGLNFISRSDTRIEA